jgi:hypothetical protein
MLQISLLSSPAALLVHIMDVPRQMLLVLLQLAHCCLHSAWIDTYCDYHEQDELHKACRQAREALLCPFTRA